MSSLVMDCMVSEETEGEKRQGHRCVVNALVVFFPFSSFYRGENEAAVLNISREGICFASPQWLHPEQYICIRLKHVTGEGPASALKSFSLAQVRWCRDLGSDGPQFSVGAAYV